MSILNRSGKQKSRLTDLKASTLYKQWYWRVGSGNPNDYIIAISANPKLTGVTGTGKTTFGLRLAKTYFDAKESEFDAKKQTTLDPHELSSDIFPNTDPGAAIIYDEAQGTPSTTGLNSKRAMKTESIEAINNIATRRKERKTLIIITQNIKSLVTDLYDYIDSWLLINNEVDYWATHYEVNPDVFDFQSRDTKTPGVEDLTWEPFPKSDRDYAYLDRLKDEANQSKDESDEDQDLPLEVQAKMAANYNEIADIPWRKMKDADEAFTYSGEYLRQKVKDLENEDEDMD